MNLKELKQLIIFIERVVDLEKVDVCIDDSRDGKKSFPVAAVLLTKSITGEIILVTKHG